MPLFESWSLNIYIRFGAGVYTSSAANKYVQFINIWLLILTLALPRSASYSSGGVMFLNKVVLGKVHNVGAFGSVSTCPHGCQSVSFKYIDIAWFELLVCTGCVWQKQRYIEWDHRVYQRRDPASVSSHVWIIPMQHPGCARLARTLHVKYTNSIFWIWRISTSVCYLFGGPNVLLVRRRVALLEGHFLNFIPNI